MGYQCHIVGEHLGSARYASILTEQERNRYANLILLCGTHHDEIDKLNPQDFPVEKLHDIKTSHELWVEEQLSAKDRWLEAQNFVYAHLIDSTTELCRFNTWDSWIAPLGSPYVRIHGEVLFGLMDFRKLTLKACLPKTIPQIEMALLALSTEIELLIRLINLHTEMEGDDWYVAVRFYKNRGFHNPNYQKDLDAFNDWEEAIFRCAEMCTKLANLFCDAVREHYNPVYFAKEGYFSVTHGPTSKGVFHWVPMITDQDPTEIYENSLKRYDKFERARQDESKLAEVWTN